MIVVMQINNPKLDPKITNDTVTYIISLQEIYKIFLLGNTGGDKTLVGRFH